MNTQQWRDQVVEAPLDADLPIVDAHHHIWTTSPAPGYDPYDGEDLLRDTMGSGHNIVATIYVDSHSNYRSHGPEHLRVVGETETAHGLAEDAVPRGHKAAGLCAAIVPHANLLLGAKVGEVLDAHVAASSRFRGIRHMAAFDPELPPIYGATAPGVMMQPEFRKGFAELASRGLSFDAWLFHSQLREFVDLAQSFPETTIVLDHLGGPIGIGRYANPREGFDTWKKALAEAVACPNVVLKLGSLNMSYTGMDATDAVRPMTSAEMAQRWRGHILTAIDLFSPARCMFESNFPVDKVSTSYGVLWNGFKRLTADLSAAERADLFERVARRTYRF
ncbi:MAG: amidohydrolase family protein [Steroidobacteraceae bacterium]